jgi:hypothetical protein
MKNGPEGPFFICLAGRSHPKDRRKVSIHAGPWVIRLPECPQLCPQARAAGPFGGSSSAHCSGRFDPPTPVTRVRRNQCTATVSASWRPEIRTPHPPWGPPATCARSKPAAQAPATCARSRPAAQAPATCARSRPAARAPAACASLTCNCMCGKCGSAESEHPCGFPADARCGTKCGSAENRPAVCPLASARHFGHITSGRPCGPRAPAFIGPRGQVFLLAGALPTLPRERSGTAAPSPGRASYGVACPARLTLPSRPGWKT